MALFDFLRKSAPPPPGTQAVPVDKRVAGLARVAGDKRQQTYDRIEALQQLVDMRSPAAAAALLKRFTFSIDPSITDQEEKEPHSRVLSPRALALSTPSSSSA